MSQLYTAILVVLLLGGVGYTMAVAVRPTAAALVVRLFVNGRLVTRSPIDPWRPFVIRFRVGQAAAGTLILHCGSVTLFARVEFVGQLVRYIRPVHLAEPWELPVEVVTQLPGLGSVKVTATEFALNVRVTTRRELLRLVHKQDGKNGKTSGS